MQTRSLMVAVLALTLFFAVSSEAFGAGAKLSVKLTPKSPTAGSKYTLTIKGKAKKGKLGTQHNRSEVDRIEQLGGTCEATPQAELAKSGTIDIGPVFVKAGKFKIPQPRTATKAAHTTIRFCIYLSSGIHKLNAQATAAYTT